MLYLACTTISSVDLAQYGVSLAKDWVSVECGTNLCYCNSNLGRPLKVYSFELVKERHFQGTCFKQWLNKLLVST